MPRRDGRSESRHIQIDSINVAAKMRSSERAAFLDKFVLSSTQEAAAKGQTLALIRPNITDFIIIDKSPEDIEKERRNFEEASRQESLFTDSNIPLAPCPYEFRFKYIDGDGKPHTNRCDDWEIHATFFRQNRLHGTKRALEEIRNRFWKDVPAGDIVFAMGTHSRYPDTWLLVGIIRLKQTPQPDLF